MQNSLNKLLGELRRGGFIKDYEVSTWSVEGDSRSIGHLRVIVNKIPLIHKELRYIPSVQSFTRVSDILEEQVEQQLFLTGIMALISNKQESERETVTSIPRRES